MSEGFRFRAHVHFPGVDADALLEASSVMLDHLLHRVVESAGAVTGVHVTGNLRTGVLVVSMDLTAVTMRAVHGHGLSELADAVSAAGATTPGWFHPEHEGGAANGPLAGCAAVVRKSEVRAPALV